MSTKKARVLVISSFFPVPQDEGDPVRVLQLVRAFASLSDLAVYAVRRPDTTGRHVDELRRLLPTATVEAFDRSVSRGAQLAGRSGEIADELRTGVPYWIGTRYSADLATRLDVTSRHFDLVVSIGEAAGAYSDHVHAPWHWDKVNVLTASTLLELRADRGLERLARVVRHVDSWRFETARSRRAATISVTSFEEAIRLESHVGRRADLIVPSTVDVPTISRRDPTRGKLVWLGRLAYAPNRRGLARFVREGWPMLAEAGMTLRIVGSGISDSERATYERVPGCEVVGFLPDLEAELVSAWAGVVPLWEGAGVKMKTLTLMSYGVPTFGTRSAFEGITPPEKEHWTAETPREIAGQLLRASEEDLRRRGEQMRALVQDDFSYYALRRRVRRLLALHGLGSSHDDDPSGEV